MYAEKGSVTIGRPVWIPPKSEKVPLIRRFHSEMAPSEVKKIGDKLLDDNYFQVIPHRSRMKISSSNIIGSINESQSPDCISAPEILLSPFRRKSNESITIDFVSTKPIIPKPKVQKKSNEKYVKKRRSKTRTKKQKKHVAKRKSENSRGRKWDCESSASSLHIESTKIVGCLLQPAQASSVQRVASQHSNGSFRLPSTVSTTHLLSPYGSYKSNKVIIKSPAEPNLPNVATVVDQNCENVKESTKYFSPVPPTFAPNSPKFQSRPGGNVRKNFLKKVSCYDEGSLGKLSLDSKSIDKALNDNSLKDRLNLIHCYGNDYVEVTKKYEMQKKKEEALKEYEERVNAKLENEKRKQLQRKQIYALNRLMTDLEFEQFKKFMNNISSNNK